MVAYVSRRNRGEQAVSWSVRSVMHCLYVDAEGDQLQGHVQQAVLRHAASCGGTEV